MLSCASPSNSSSRSRKKAAGFLSTMLKESLALADEPKSRTSYNSDGSQPSPAKVVHLPVGDLAIAIQPWLLQLRGFLSNGRTRTIGILGPGGVGKTTILKALNNEILGRSNKKHKFHLVIFAPVSRDSNLKRLQAILARRLNLPCRENESTEITAIRISMALRGRRFLLLLDDLQQPLHLQEIGIPLPDGQNKCMLIFTTRSESVCNKMNADKVLVVEPLDSEGSLQLFRRCAGEESASPEIIDVAKSFASECGGLALALITVGRSLASIRRPTKEEWMRCLEIFKHVKKKLSSIFRGMDQSTTLLFSSFYLSYTMLGIDERNCLLYCSLYPKNYSINMEELIRYWMGEGLFLKKQDSIDGARVEGSKIITKLKSLRMLEDGDSPDSEVFMHDIMHDLALSIVKKEFVVQAAGQEEDRKIKVNTNMVSLMNNTTIKTLDQLRASCPHLESLILRRNGEIKHDSSLVLRSSSSSLGLLDLSHTRVKEIPSGIGRLVSLRYLDLSFTKIKVLPREIGELVNLLQLLLEGTSSLASIPGGVLPKLTKIVALNLYASFGEWELPAKATAESAAAASIEELKCLKQLNELGITICSTQALDDFVDSSGLTESTRYLFVNECDDLENLHISKSSFDKLQRVTVADCGALEKLIVGGSNSSGDPHEDGSGDWRLLNLEALRLKGLYKAQIIWRGVPNYSGCLPKLREVDISYCHELRDVSWVLELGCLERVKLDYCKRIEHVVNVDVAARGGSTTAARLPRLKTVTLRNLPHLKSISNLPLPYPLLESVKVLRCPQLRTLPRRTGNDPSPVFIFGEMEWWNAVERSSGEEQRPPSFWYFRAAKENY